MASLNIWKKIVGIVLLVVAVLFVSLLFVSKQYLIKNHRVTTATIINVQWKSRSLSRFVVTGIFYLKGREYESSCQLGCTGLNGAELRNKLINVKVSAVYNPSLPWNNFLLIEKDTYKMYNVSFPDSLEWVNKLVSCR